MIIGIVLPEHGGLLPASYPLGTDEFCAPLRIERGIAVVTQLR